MAPRTPVEEILALAKAPAPHTCLYLPDLTPSEDVGERLRLQWKHARERLEADGAPAAHVEVIEALLHTGSPADSPSAVVVDGEGVATSGAPAGVAPRVITRTGVVPSLGPLVAWAQAQVPHVVVLADRTGADLVVAEPGRAERHEVVEGTDHEITKVHAGGWSQRRIQQRAENNWEHNAAGVADEVAEQARRIGASVVVAAGDERALGYLEEHLPADVAPLLRVAEGGGGRSHDGSEALVAEAVDRVLATVVAEQLTEELRRYGDALGQGGAACQGVSDTFAMLREALVDTLYVHDDPDDDRVAWCSPDAPTLVAAEPETLSDLGAEPVEARLVDVAVWAAAGTGARVVVVPAHGQHSPAERIGAHLRAR